MRALVTVAAVLPAVSAIVIGILWAALIAVVLETVLVLVAKTGNTDVIIARVIVALII